MDHRDFEQFAPASAAAGSRAGAAASIDLPAPGGPTHQQIVAAGGGDFERALGAFLALDVARDRAAAPAPRSTSAAAATSTCVPLKWLASWISERGAIMSRSAGLAQAASGPQAAGQIRPSPRGVGGDRRRQDAGDRRDRAVEAELADDRKPASASCGMAPIAAIRPSAIGRS